MRRFRFGHARTEWGRDDMSFKHRWDASADLWRHYANVFRHFWKHREELSGRMLNEHEAEFLPAALSLQEQPVSPASRLVAKVLIALIAVLVLWSVIGKVDIVVNAAGKIIPSARTKTIGSVDVASVKALHVEEGQAVKAGQTLIELDTSAPDAERDKAVGENVLALLQVARSQAMIAAVDRLQPPHLPRPEGVPEDKWRAAQHHLDGQYRDFLARLRRVEGDIQRCREALPCARTPTMKTVTTMGCNHDGIRWIEHLTEADKAAKLAAGG